MYVRSEVQRQDKPCKWGRQGEGLPRRCIDESKPKPATHDATNGEGSEDVIQAVQKLEGSRNKGKD